jgi:hypothetical protein
MSLITINIGGTLYTTDVNILTQSPYFQAVFSGYENEYDDDGNVFIDRDGINFKYILEYLEYGYTKEKSHIYDDHLKLLQIVYNNQILLNKLERECNHYLIDIIVSRPETFSVEQFGIDQNGYYLDTGYIVTTFGTLHDAIVYCTYPPTDLRLDTSFLAIRHFEDTRPISMREILPFNLFHILDEDDGYEDMYIDERYMERIYRLVGDLRLTNTNIYTIWHKLQYVSKNASFFGRY